MVALPVSRRPSRAPAGALAPFLVLALGLGSGCARDTGGPTPGGTVRTAVVDLPSLDPDAVPDVQATPFLSLLHEGLVRFDSAGVVVPGHALEWEIAGDGLTYTFRLDPGRRFEDGSPIDASAYERAAARVFASAPDAPGRTRFWALAGVIGEHGSTADRALDAADSATVVLRLARPDPDLLEKLASPRYLVPRATPESEAGLGRRASSGPYRIAGEDPEETIFVRNPHYGGSAPAYPDTIRVGTGVSPRRAATQLEAGRLDLLWGLPDPYRQRLRRHPEIATVEADSTAAVHWLLVLNCSVAPTARREARRAVALSVPRRELSDRFRSLATAERGFLPGPGPGPGGEAERFDPEGARAALASARYARGVTLRLYVPRLGPEEEAARTLIPHAGIAGLHTELEAVRRSAFQDGIGGRRGGPAHLLAWRSPCRDPLAGFAELLLNRSLSGRWSGNLCWYRTGGALDTLVLRALQAGDPAARSAGRQALGRELAGATPYVPLARYRDLAFHVPGLRGVTVHPRLGPRLGALWRPR